MKKMLTAICFSCVWLLAHGKPAGLKCGDDVSVIQSEFQISYGDTISAGINSELPMIVSWSVFPQTGLNQHSGKGKFTGDLVFSNPGEYKITFDIPAHGEHPAKKEVVTVKVSGIKMLFDTKNVTFSSPLTQGNVSGVTLTIPVKVLTFDERPIEFSSRDIKSTGIANISAHLKNGDQTLKVGHNELNFELTGTISQPGNIQFRVYDMDGRATFFNYLITN